MLSLGNKLSSLKVRTFSPFPGSNKRSTAHTTSQRFSTLSSHSIPSGTSSSICAGAHKSSFLASKRLYSVQRSSTYVAPTAEHNEVGKPREELSHVPWWDKIGVNTAMKYREAQNWQNPAMSDEEIEKLVSEMPTDLELAGLAPKERDEYLRARYAAIQLQIVRARSINKRNHETFEPVTFDSIWTPDVHEHGLAQRPSDAPFHEPPKDLLDLDEKSETDPEFEYESLPPQPFGPRPPPPPLPDVSYWKQRKTLEKASIYDQYLSKKYEQERDKLAKMEVDFMRRAPWFSQNESERVQAENKLRSDPESREKLEQSMSELRYLRQMKRRLLESQEERYEAKLRAQGGHERLAWHQITAEEWENMNDVEFAFWRFSIANDWMKTHDMKKEFGDVEHPGTVVVALRRSIQDWQRALYEYQRTQRPVHMTADDLSIWHYELTKQEWYKAGRALENRLFEVERRAVLHRRLTVLTYLGNVLSDWVAHYTSALDTAKVLEKWGLLLIDQAAPALPSDAPQSAERFRLREKLKFDWTGTMTNIMNGLQAQKEAGPFPFEVPLEKLDQHLIDNIYTYLVKEEELADRVQDRRIFENSTDLPPMPSELKLLLTNPIAMLASSGNDAASGLFGPKLAKKMAEEEQRQKTATLKEIDRRTHLMLRYWHDHNISEVEIDGITYKIPASEDDRDDIPFQVVERVYLDLLDQGLDVHGLYETPQWETDEAGRYRASSLSPFEADNLPAVSLDTLTAGGSELAFGLLSDLSELAFPTQSSDRLAQAAKSAGSKLKLQGNTGSASSTSKTSKSLLDRIYSVSAFSNTASNGERSETTPDWFLPVHPLRSSMRSRDLQVLKKVATSAPPQVIRMQREAAFYSTDAEMIDPHPHLWQRLLTLVWQMRLPPRFLVSRQPEVYQEWQGLLGADFLAEVEAAASEDDDGTSQLADPRALALSNPQRKAWELARRGKAYKSMLLGDTLTDAHYRTIERISKTTSQMQSLSNQLSEGKSELSASMESEIDSHEASNTDKRRKFELLRNSIIPNEEIEAAAWMASFDIYDFIRNYGGLKLAYLLKLEVPDKGEVKLANFCSRFSDSALMTVQSYLEPPASMKLFQSTLDELLRTHTDPQKALELGNELFQKRQKIQKSFLKGMPKASTALMMNYYLAYALKSKIELFMQYQTRKPTMNRWVSQFVEPSQTLKTSPSLTPNPSLVDQPPKSSLTLVSAIYQILFFPFYLIKRAVAPKTADLLSDASDVGDLEVERKRANLLTLMTQQLEAMNAAQPWRMWSPENWSWRDSLKPAEQLDRERSQYEKAMNYPRKAFWLTQRYIWEEYLDSTLGTFHQLMIEQRLRQGIPTLRDMLTVDGTGADAHYTLGETFLSSGKYSEAAEAYRLAARYGSLDAMFALGRLYSEQYYPRIENSLSPTLKLEQPRRETYSRQHLLAAAQKGHLSSMLRLAKQCSMPPPGADVDVNTTVAMLRLAIETHQSEDARVALASLYSKSSKPNDIRQAIELFKQSQSSEAHKLARQLQARLDERSHVDAGHLKDAL